MSPFRRKLQRCHHAALFHWLVWCRPILALLALSRVHDVIIARVLRRRKLFDRQFYLERNDDVAESTVEPLMHYIRWGDREGRWPMALFDPLHYARQAGLQPASKGNRLLHYVCIGRYRGFSPSPWFDLAYYLSRNKDVARSGVDPLLHFVRWGGTEGRDPSPRFASAYYLSAFPDVLQWGANPLIHYLEQGQFEGRLPLPAPEQGSLGLSPPSPIAPPAGEWEAMRRHTTPDRCLVDVIVPVFAGAAVTLRCLNSVLRAAPLNTAHELIVINDGSEDRELVSQLEELASKGLFTLIHNRKNRGFVSTANRGMRLHPKRDVVLLNSDTEVYGNWLDRLRTCAQSEPRVATVTPLSNNATVCSYPNFLHDNPYPLEIGYDELDRLAGVTNTGASVQAPTGVGFCLYLKRDCIKEIGLFDEEAFGRGYGEENDFCQRAIRRGWTNLIACDVFVRHWGSASFQGERARRTTSAMRLLKARYPHYHRDIRRFIHADPLSKARARLDLARLQRLRKDRNVLLVTHARGGGTERHVLEDVGRLGALDQGAFFLRPGTKSGQVLLSHPEIDALPNLAPLNLLEPAALSSLLKQLGISEIHIHHLIDFHPDAARVVQQLAAELGVSIRVMIHDYTAICPRVNLVDATGLYCGEPAEQVCNACIKRNGSEFGRVDIVRWRLQWAQLLQRAGSVLVPDPDVAARLSDYFPGTELAVQPHEAPSPTSVAFRPGDLSAEERLRVVVIGAIGKIKGYEVLLACARNARKRQLPIDFVVYGYTMNDLALRGEGVKVTGRYLEHQADMGLEALEAHCIWFPYVWPETYSYTLSIGLRCGRPVFAFDIGAIASRLRSLGADGYLLPLSMARQSGAINDRFLAYRDTLRVRSSAGIVAAGDAVALGRASQQAAGSGVPIEEAVSSPTTIPEVITSTHPGEGNILFDRPKTSWSTLRSQPAPRR